MHSFCALGGGHVCRDVSAVWVIQGGQEAAGRTGLQPLGGWWAARDRVVVRGGEGGELWRLYKLSVLVGTLSAGVLNGLKVPCEGLFFVPGCACQPRRKCWMVQDTSHLLGNYTPLLLVLCAHAQVKEILHQAVEILARKLDNLAQGVREAAERAGAHIDAY